MTESTPDLEMQAAIDRFVNAFRGECDDWAKRYFPREYSPAFACTMNQWVRENLPSFLIDIANESIERAFAITSAEARGR